MSEAENPTTEREAENAPAPAEKPAGDKPSGSSKKITGSVSGAKKKCTECGSRQPAKRTRCTSCGAQLPDKTEDVVEREAAAAAAAAAASAPPAAPAAEATAAAASPGPASAVADPASADAKAPETAAAKPAETVAVDATAEAAKAEAAKAEAAKLEVAKADAAKAEAARAEAAKAEAAKADAAKAEAAKTETTSEPAGGAEVTLEALLRAANDASAPATEAPAEAAKVETAKPEPTKVETAKPEPTKVETAKPEPAKVEAPKVEVAAPVVAEKPRPSQTVSVVAAAVASAPAAKKPGPSPATGPVRAAAPPAPNVGVIVKTEIKTELAPVQKAVEHVGDQLKAGLTLVAKGQRGLEEKVTVVARAVEELAKDTLKRRKDYDALYEEMRQYKTNFLESAQKPLYNELLLLFDSVQRIMRRIEEIQDTAIPKDAVSEAFKQVKDELVEILYRRDIEMIEDHPRKLDVKSQKPVRRVETDVPAEDRDVVQVVREGFTRNGAVFRPQEVVVKRCLAVASDEQPIEGDGDEKPAGATVAPANETSPATTTDAATTTTKAPEKEES